MDGCAFSSSLALEMEVNIISVASHAHWGPWESTNETNNPCYACVLLFGFSFEAPIHFISTITTGHELNASVFWKIPDVSATEAKPLVRLFCFGVVTMFLALELQANHIINSVPANWTCYTVCPLFKKLTRVWIWDLLGLKKLLSEGELLFFFITLRSC